MLKNKREREEYIHNEGNWTRVCVDELEGLHYEFSKLILPNGTIIIREVVRENDEFHLFNVEYKETHITKKYRILRDEYITTSLSMTFLIDYIGKIKWKVVQNKENKNE